MKKRIWLLSFFLLFLTVVKAQGYKPGDEAIDFKLKNVDGKLVSLSDYKQAKGFIVIFICNPCPYVKLYEQRILELNNKYAPLGYPVIAINPNDAELSKADAFDKMQERARERKYTFPYLVDETQEIA
ncbi:redoxin domain-containing protein [Pseudopedobacter beijingensis]|uniref:Redoxin domain-containing protein n=1 Tax=Pseudopedobacter beijingensis TaxID=1207056 RepID=A0ABW4IJ34_9SPHI